MDNANQYVTFIKRASIKQELNFWSPVSFSYLRL